MMPVRRSNQTWLPSIFNDFFDNDWMVKANATAPAINVIESDKDYKVEVSRSGNDQRRLQDPYQRRQRLGYLYGKENRKYRR